MKKIAYLMSHFPVFSETFIGTEIRAMQAHGHTLLPIAFQRPIDPPQPRDQSLAAQTRYLSDLGQAEALSALSQLTPTRLAKGLAFAYQQQGLGKKSLCYAAVQVAALVKAAGCTHIHAHFAQATAATAIVAARFLGIRVSFVGHGYDVYATPADLPLKLCAADFAIAVCADMVQDFQTLAPAAKVGLVYCGIEPHHFTPTPPLPSQPPNQRLLFIGRLCETKGVADLLNALAKIPAAQRPGLDLVGTGPLADSLKQQVKQLGLNSVVHFLGARPAEWLAQHGPHYLALVAPFKTAPNGDRDTGPVVVKEAMAMGLPVITTHFMGCKEMVSDASGYRLPVGDTDSLTAAIQALLALSPAARQAMGQAGRQRILAHFTAQQQAKRLSQLIEAKP